MEDIISALENIEEQGSFCGIQTTSIDKLKIEIKEFGSLTLPLSASKTKALIKHAKPARFGWRDQTLLDKTVRHAWEISKSQIKIDTNIWNKELKRILDDLKKDLGLPDNVTLKASFHNLLIYEPGQFFSAHQDSEKCDGMIASLVIVVPSAHRGGSLMIDHQGEKKQFQTSRFSLDQLTCIAFYADCHHEVKEVKEGYRVTLTYNLILEHLDKKVKIPNKTKLHDELINSLRTYFIDKSHSEKSLTRCEEPRQFVYLLDHNYTQKGLSWSHLKNGDLLRAEALKVAADTLDLEIHMVLADVQETWDCEMDYDPYEYRQRKYRCWEDEEDEDDEHSEDSATLNELIDSNTMLKHWINQKGEPLNYKECYVSSRHIGWTKASNEFEPFQSEYEGYMGNYGNTMDRWYHRAAIILWQKRDHYPVLFEMDPGSVINELLSLSKKKSQEEHIRQIITSLLPYWSIYLGRSNEQSTISTIFKLALYVKDHELAQNMIANFDIKILTSDTAKQFLSLQETYGTSWCLSILNSWSTSKERWGLISKCEKISEIIKDFSGSKHGNKELTDWVLKFQLSKIKEQNESSKKNRTRVSLIEDLPTRFKDMMDFIKACTIVHTASIFVDLLNHVINNMELYPQIELIEAIEFLNDTLKSDQLEQWHYQKLFDYAHDGIQKEKKLGLRDKDDWSIKEKSSCKCQDCTTLNDFLQSNTINMKWPMAKDRRAHIHRTIDGLGIPVTHETERTGSPHKLILIKTEKLHVHAKKRFNKLETALSRLARR